MGDGFNLPGAPVQPQQAQVQPPPVPEDVSQRPVEIAPPEARNPSVDQISSGIVQALLSPAGPGQRPSQAPAPRTPPGPAVSPAQIQSIQPPRRPALGGKG